MLLTPSTVVAATAPGEMVMESAWLVVVGTESTACTAKLQVWAVIGAPETVPVELPRLRPAHKLPLVMLHVTGAVQLAVPTVWE
jgi:hypothetical protein